MIDGDREVGRIYRVSPHAGPEKGGSGGLVPGHQAKELLPCVVAERGQGRVQGQVSCAHLGSNLALLPNGAAKAGA